MKPDADTLARAPLFAGLPKEAREAVALFCHGRRYAPGDVVFREGEPASSLFMVAEGSLVAIARAGGHPREVGRIVAGEVIGETSLVDHAPRAATVTAAGPAVVYELTTEGFEILRESAPVAARALTGAAIRGLLGRIHQLEQRLERELERAGTPW